MIHIWSLFGPLEGADSTALTFLVAVLTPPPQHVCTLSAQMMSRLPPLCPVVLGKKSSAEQYITGGASFVVENLGTQLCYCLS